MATKPKTSADSNPTAEKTTTNPPFDIAPYLADIAGAVDYHAREMPDGTYRSLKRYVDRAIMESNGYSQMTFIEAVQKELTDLVTFDRSKVIVDPVEVGGMLWEYKGGSISPNDSVWAK